MNTTHANRSGSKTHTEAGRPERPGDPKPGFRADKNGKYNLLDGWNEEVHRKRKKRRRLRKGTGGAITARERHKDHEMLTYVYGFDDEGNEIKAADWKRAERLMHDWAADCTYNTTARKVLQYLVSKVDHKPCRSTYGHTHKYTPTQARIAKDLGKSENAVKKAIQRLKKAGIIGYMLETYYEKVEGRTSKRTRVRDYWLCCGSLYEYANPKNGKSGKMTPLDSGKMTPLDSGKMTPSSNRTNFPKNIVASESEKQKTTNRMTSVMLRDVGLRDMKHVRALANKHNYQFGSDGTVETCLDWLEEKHIFDARAIKVVLTAPNQSYAYLNENFNRMNGRRLTLGLIAD